MSHREEDEDGHGPVYFEDSRCSAETDRAVRVRIEGEYKWVPKSVLHDDSEVYEEGHKGKLAIKHWWCEKEGLV